MRSLLIGFFCLLWTCASFGSEPTTVFLVGDSTMAQKLVTHRPETGWGERLQQYFDIDLVRVENYARNGRSTRTFIEEGRWAAVTRRLKRGDYVFIQFGHNDSSIEKTDRYTPPDAYRANLVLFIAEVRAKHATPVLMTPVMRRHFDEQGVLENSLGVYPDIVREVAQARRVVLLDMHCDSFALLETLGQEDSKKLFMNLAPGENPNYPNGLNDNTHFTELGASEIAKLAAREIAASVLPLAKLIQ